MQQHIFTTSPLQLFLLFLSLILLAPASHARVSSPAPTPCHHAAAAHALLPQQRALITPAPYLRPELRRRDVTLPVLVAPDNICGFFGASSSASYYCPVEDTCKLFLDIFTANGAAYGGAGCCDSSGCKVQNTCIDSIAYAQGQRCTGSYCVACSVTSRPYCNSITYTDLNIRDFFCGAQQTLSAIPIVTTYTSPSAGPLRIYTSSTTILTGVTALSTSTPPTTTTSSSRSTTSSLAASTTAPPAPAPSSTNTGAIAGGVVGGLAGLALISLVIFLLLRRKRLSRQHQHQQQQQLAAQQAAAHPYDPSFGIPLSPAKSPVSVPYSPLHNVGMDQTHEAPAGDPRWSGARSYGAQSPPPGWGQSSPQHVAAYGDRSSPPGQQGGYGGYYAAPGVHEAPGGDSMGREGRHEAPT